MTLDDLNLLAKAVPEAGEIVGCYFNNSATLTDSIVITVNGLVDGCKGQFRLFRYCDMSHVVRSERKGVASDEVELQMRSQSRVTVVIRGKNPERGTHDKFGLMMFLDSVIPGQAAATFESD
jgi:hypothetical protein